MNEWMNEWMNESICYYIYIPSINIACKRCKKEADTYGIRLPSTFEIPNILT